MSENENKDLLFGENAESAEADEAVKENEAALSEDAEEVKEVEAEPFTSEAEPEAVPSEDKAEEPVQLDEAYSETEGETVESPETDEAQQETSLQNDETAFNPYAPGNNVSDEGVSPSYSQPVNSQSSAFNGGYPTNYGYNNQGYNQSGYYHTPENNNKGGKKAIIAVVIICVVVAAIALISSFFGDGGKNQPDTTATAPHSAIPTETTQPTTLPSVPETTQQLQGSSELQTTAPTTQAASQTTVQTTTQAALQPTTQQQINSIWVAEKVRPSVVGVLAYQQGELAGEGSGVLMNEDENGTCTYVVTCAHVINEPGCEFAILLLDGTRYEAEVVALDERTDIGVLKVEATGLPLAEFGDSSSLKVGEPIYAIGNPGGSEYFGSITNGIVASIDRSISATYTMTCIQHNAAINPGNSGGALVNTAGQVIGINSSKIAKTDYEGMGFAVPSAIFASVVDSLIKYGYVPNRPELGIKYASVSEYQLYSIIVSIKGLPKGSIVIAEIPEGSALANTGAQVGDLITAVNGKKMDTPDVLLDLIDTGAVGDTLTLTLCRINDRNYETSTFDVTVALVENKGSATTTTQAPTLPQQGGMEDFDDFFGDFFGW